MKAFDLALYVPAMPAAIAREILESENEHVAEFRRVCMTMYIAEAPLSAAAMGWVLGIAVLHDGGAPEVKRARAATPEARVAMLDAFAAGLLLGQPSKPKQWKAVQDLLTETPVLPAAFDRIATKLATDKRVSARAFATWLAQRLGPAATPKSEDTGDASLFEEVLAVWQTTRDPELEPAIWQLGRFLAGSIPPIVAKATTEVEAKWHALAASPSPIAISRLLDTPWPATAKAIRKRFDRLYALDPDPRISRAIAIHARTWLAEHSLDFEIRRVLERAPTIAILPYVDAFAPSLDRCRDLIWRATTPAPVELVERARKRVGLEPLYAAVYANPDDHAARLVLGDALQQLGDPRGEFIAGVTTEILDEYFGPLPMMHDAVFEGGFLVSCSIWTAGDPRRPEWSTVRTLRLGGTDDLTDLVHGLHRLNKVVMYSPDPLIEASRRRKDRFPKLPVLEITTPPPPLRSFAELDIDTLVCTRFPREQLGQILAERADGPAALELQFIDGTIVEIRGSIARIQHSTDAALFQQLAESGLTHVE